MNYLENLTEAEVSSFAQELCKERSYPQDLSMRNISKGSIG
jgi:hypothetical protein